jgi:ribosomal protein L19E
MRGREEKKKERRRGEGKREGDRKGETLSQSQWNDNREIYG